MPLGCVRIQFVCEFVSHLTLSPPSSQSSVAIRCCPHLSYALAVRIGSGGVPTISTAWDRVLENQAAESVGKAVASYVEVMAKQLGMEPPDLTLQAKTAEARKRHLRGASSRTRSNKKANAATDAGVTLGANLLPMTSERLLETHIAAQGAASEIFKASIRR